MPKLTKRERECLYLASLGNTTSEIAEKLGLSERTVGHYLASAAKKLSANTRPQAVANAMRLGLIDGEQSVTG